MDFSKLFRTAGRIGRQEYWLTYLALTLAGLACFCLASLTRSGLLAGLAAVAAIGYAWLSIVFSIKRLHDTGRSGWWLVKMAAANLACMAVVVSAGTSFVGMHLVLLGCFGTLALSVYQLCVLGLQRSDATANTHGVAHSGSVLRRRASRN